MAVGKRVLVPTMADQRLIDEAARLIARLKVAHPGVETISLWPKHYDVLANYRRLQAFGVRLVRHGD